MAADVALAVKNGLNRVFVSNRGWWESRGHLPGGVLMTVVVGIGRGNGRRAGCGGMWRDRGGGKERSDVATFELALLNLGRRGPRRRRW